MDEQFWQSRWRAGRIGFHDSSPNIHLQNHFDALGVAPSAHVFVPLSGKTLDLDWLLARGHTVSGIEFNRGAVEEVFERLGLVPEVAVDGSLTRFTHGGLTLWHGDFFNLGAQDLNHVDAVYDRAALVALPDDLRAAYAKHLTVLTHPAPQLLVTFDYDQSYMTGPPFSVPHRTVEALYAEAYTFELIVTEKMKGTLGEHASGQEQVWKMSAR